MLVTNATHPPKGKSMDITKQNHDQLGQAVERLTQEGRKFLDNGDLAVAAMTLKDAADLQDIHSRLKLGRTELAIRIINGLDTAAREEIPAAVYEAIMQHA